MKVFISTCCLSSSYTLEEVLKRYSVAGIDNVELTSGRGYIPNLYNLLAKYNFNYLVHNYFPDSEIPFVLNLSSSDEEIRKKSAEHIKNCIDLSKKLGSNFYAFHGGFLYQPSENRNEKTGLLAINPRVRSVGKEGAFNHFKEGLSEVLKYAEEKNIKLLIENPPCPVTHIGKLLFSKADDYLKLFKDFSSNHLGTLLDFGHLKISAKTYGFRYSDFIENLKEKIWAIHISDNDGENDQNSPIEGNGWIAELIKKYNLTNLPATLEIGNTDINTILGQKKLLEST